MSDAHDLTPIPAAMLEALHQSQRVLISSHVRPDGDAVGSLLGMAAFMRALGKDVTVSLQDQPPSELRRVPTTSTIVHPSRIHGAFDTFISMDASTPDRLGNVLEIAPKPYRLLVIDHHVTNSNFGDINWVSPRDAATCQMLVRLADALGVEITGETAQILMTGLVTDTLCFRTSNTTAATMEAGMRLLALGANLAEITENVLDVRSFPVVKLWGEVLDHAQCEDGVLWVTLSKDEFARVGIDDHEDGSLSSFLIRTQDTNVSATFIEKSDKQGNPAVECSFRSRSGYDISGIAASLGGGGHPQAGGVTILGTLEAVVAQVVPLLKGVSAGAALPEAQVA